jgi:integrase
MLYRQTRDVALVAEIMGHSSTDTTRLYVKVDPFEAAGALAAISRLSGELP